VPALPAEKRRDDGAADDNRPSVIENETLQQRAGTRIEFGVVGSAQLKIRGWSFHGIRASLSLPAESVLAPTEVPRVQYHGVPR
jgi:hypothetical protein